MYFLFQILYSSFLPGSCYSFYFIFHAVVVHIQLLVVVNECLEHPHNDYLNSMSEILLASISFSSFSGDSSTPFDWGFFFCIPILGDIFCLFLHLSALLCLHVILR